MRLAIWLLAAACAAPVAPIVRNTAPTPEPSTATPGTLRARVLSLALFDTYVLVELAAGTASGIDKRATIVAPKFPNAEIVLIRVDKTVSIAKTMMTRAQVEANPIFEITLRPPPPPEPADGLLDP